MQYTEYVKTTEFGAFFMFVAFLINPVLSPYIRGLGFDDFQIGLIFSLYPLCIILFSPVMGRLSDVMGRNSVILLGVLVDMAAMLLYYFSGHYILIAAARVLNALGYMTVSLAVLAKIEDSVDGKARGRYSGWFMSIEYLSKVTAPLIGGLVADMFFVRAPFIVSFALLVSLLPVLFKKGLRVSRRPAREDFNMFREIREFVSDKNLRVMAVLGAVMHATIPATTVFLPILIIDRFGANFTMVGFAFFAVGFFHLFQFYFGNLSDRMGRKRTLLPGTLVFGMCLILVNFSFSYILLIGVLFLMGAGGAVWNISAWSLMSDIGESAGKEGQVVMTYSSIAKTGSFLSYIMGGLIASIYGEGVFFIITGWLVIAGTAAAFLMWRNPA